MSGLCLFGWPSKFLFSVQRHKISMCVASSKAYVTCRWLATRSKLETDDDRFFVQTSTSVPGEQLEAGVGSKDPLVLSALQ